MTTLEKLRALSSKVSHCRWFLGVAIPCIAVAPSVKAGIVDVAGQVELISPPADARGQRLESNTMARAWNERQEVHLGSSLAIDAAAPRSYSSPTFGVLPAGTVVSSHLLHADTVDNTIHNFAGSIRFDGDIVGVVCWNETGQWHLDASDPMFRINTRYPDPGNMHRGALESGDSFTISADRRTLTFQLRVNNIFDQIRVLTTRPPVTGDMNCDGFLTVADIGGFVLAVTNPAEYAAAFPECDITIADTNDDGFVTVADIGPFVALLLGM